MLKPELQAKFIQHLSNRKNKTEEGFTLIELLVVVIIIGVLAAIALPSLLGQVNKAKQAEAKTYTGTVNRAQQAFYLEYQKFATNLNELQVGIKDSANYKYSIVGGKDKPAQFNSDLQPEKTGLKTYYGLVGTIPGDSDTKESLTLALACESIKPGEAVTDQTGGTFDKDVKCLADKFTTLAR